MKDDQLTGFRYQHSSLLPKLIIAAANTHHAAIAAANHHGDSDVSPFYLSLQLHRIARAITARGYTADRIHDAADSATFEFCDSCTDLHHRHKRNLFDVCQIVRIPHRPPYLLPPPEEIL
jgi:hypothetical protein